MKNQLKDDATLLAACRKRVGRVVEGGPNERITTKQVKERMLARASRDPQFRREMFRHPKFVWALALEQTMGIQTTDFLQAIKTVEFHEENEEVLYLKIPACHGGCKAPGVKPAPECHSGDSCHVCGLQFKPLPSEPTVTQALESLAGPRKYIEAKIREHSVSEPSFRNELMEKTLETYMGFASELMKGNVPAYLAGVRKIVLLDERADEIHVVIANGQAGVSKAKRGNHS